MVQQKIRSPSLMLFPEEDCLLYNPDEDKVYKPKRDLSGFRFLANSGKWFLVVDPGLKLSIIDLFNEENKIDLPPLESIEGADYILERQIDTELVEKVFDAGDDKNPVFDPDTPCAFRTAEELRGVLWVDEDSKEELQYLVVWRFDASEYIGFCKNGHDRHRGTPTDPGIDRTSLPWQLQGLDHMVLQRDTLYILTPRRYIRILDFSGQVGFKDLSHNNMLQMLVPALETKFHSKIERIAVTRSGQVLLVEIIVYKDATSTRQMIFRLCKRDPTLDHNPYRNLAEVDSLGHEALFLDSGIIVPADKTLGIEPNSIYFTRPDRVRSMYPARRIFDICVYNLATKTLKRFPRLSELNIKDALWFLPS